MKFLSWYAYCNKFTCRVLLQLKFWDCIRVLKCCILYSTVTNTILYIWSVVLATVYKDTLFAYYILLLFSLLKDIYTQVSVHAYTDTYTHILSMYVTFKYLLFTCQFTSVLIRIKNYRINWFVRVIKGWGVMVGGAT